jgi:hypothetical protein
MRQYYATIWRSECGAPVSWLATSPRSYTSNILIECAALAESDAQSIEGLASIAHEHWFGEMNQRAYTSDRREWLFGLDFFVGGIKVVCLRNSKRFTDRMLKRYDHIWKWNDPDPVNFDPRIEDELEVCPWIADLGNKDSWWLPAVIPKLCDPIYDLRGSLENTGWTPWIACRSVVESASQ